MSTNMNKIPSVGFSSFTDFQKFEHDCHEALIYTRVSSKAQVKRGDGLKSQETRCREYAKYKDYSIIDIYKDDLTGETANRTDMQRMISFIKSHYPKRQFVVIIDDISRFARSVRVHEDLRDSIREAGGILESPTIEFGFDADSRAFEYMMATMSQYKREQNAEQTVRRMRSRLMNGYWCFPSPIGYKHEDVEGHNGKFLVRDEPLASIIQEGLEGFASERFGSQVEVKRFFESRPEFPKDLPNGEIRNQKITDILKRPVYAGMVGHEEWLVPFKRGKHEPLISFETHKKIQKRLQKRCKAPVRKNISEDFALRGFALCGDCYKPLTASWSTSKTGKKYPYYECFNRNCCSYRKSIRRDDIEGEFAKLLKNLRPTHNLFEFVHAMFKDAWSQRGNQLEATKTTLRKEVSTLEKKIGKLIDCIMDEDSHSVAIAYKRKISQLELDKQIAIDRLNKRPEKPTSFEDKFELEFKFIANPWNLWLSDKLEHKRNVLKLVFSDRLAYHRKKGFSNPKLSLPFSYLNSFHVQNCEMARRGRFELPTP